MSLIDRRPPRHIGAILTRHSIFEHLDDPEDPAWEASWAYIARTYRAPMEGYVRRVLGRATGRAPAADDVADVVQSFLTDCVEKRWLTRADPEVGCFRAFAQALLKRYAHSWLRDRSRKKRSPGEGRALLSLDEELDRAPDDPASAPDATAFDREWARRVLERALARLREERERYHTVIQDLIETDGAGSPDIAERVELSRKQFPVLKHRARERFAHYFVEELRNTVRDDEAFREEWRALVPYLP